MEPLRLVYALIPFTIKHGNKDSDLKDCHPAFDTQCCQHGVSTMCKVFKCD